MEMDENFPRTRRGENTGKRAGLARSAPSIHPISSLSTLVKKSSALRA
jgi:hypothetical protein